MDGLAIKESLEVAWPEENNFPQVSVFGGYRDPRGDARQNSMSLLKAFQECDRTLEVIYYI